MDGQRCLLLHPLLLPPPRSCAAAPAAPSGKLWTRRRLRRSRAGTAEMKGCCRQMTRCGGDARRCERASRRRQCARLPQQQACPAPAATPRRCSAPAARRQSTEEAEGACRRAVLPPSRPRGSGRRRWARRAWRRWRRRGSAATRTSIQTTTTSDSDPFVVLSPQKHTPVPRHQRSSCARPSRAV